LSGEEPQDCQIFDPCVVIAGARPTTVMVFNNHGERTHFQRFATMREVGEFMSRLEIHIPKDAAKAQTFMDIPIGKRLTLKDLAAAVQSEMVSDYRSLGVAEAENRVLFPDERTDHCVIIGEFEIRRRE
jgi:hypothetical protein